MAETSDEADLPATRYPLPVSSAMSVQRRPATLASFNGYRRD